MTLEEFFAGFEDSRLIFEAVRTAVEEIGPVEIRVTCGGRRYDNGMVYQNCRSAT